MTLDADLLRNLLKYDPETGVFTRAVPTLMPRGGVKVPAGAVAGGPTTLGYIAIRVLGRKYKAHRLAFLYMTGGWPSGEVDHINHQTGDNRWSNLRDVSRAANQQNQIKPTSRSSTRAMGVTPRGDRFIAQIAVNGKKKHLGCFASVAAAEAAYVSAKRQLHAGCTI